MTGSSSSNVLPFLRHDRGRASGRHRPFTSLLAGAADDRLAAEAGPTGQDHPEARGSDQLISLETEVPARPGPPGQPAVKTNISAGTATIVLRGELDLAITPSLSEHLARVLEDKPRQLVFDMASVGFLDCAAARLIVSTGRSLPGGQQPVIRGPSHAVRRILALTGLDNHCKVETGPGR